MKLSLFLILIITGLAGAMPVFALQITNYPAFLNIEEGMSLTALASVIFKALLMAGAVAGLVMITLGGVSYLTSAGNPAKTKDAKNQIFTTILGLVILFSSWLILNTINPNLTNIQEPTAIPVPEAEEPVVPTKPTAPDPAAFFYIPLGKFIDDVVSQEKETVLKMRDFASSATECNRSQCEGGTCSYYVSVPCPEPPPEEEEEEPPAEAPKSNWWDLWDLWDLWGSGDSGGMLKLPVIHAQSDCGYWESCSAPCNTGDPCPANRSTVINEVLAASQKMEAEMSKLQQAKSKIGGCILQEDTILLSCQEVLDIFRPDEGEEPLAQWDEIQDCRQGYNFYCLYGMDEDGWLDEIILPFETIEESVAKTRELGNIISSCNCSGCSFCCACCGSCSGTPCPSQTYSFLADAIGAVNELEARLNRLKETVTEITGLSMADEISALTCSEAYSWLKSIKESGCPGAKVFPCCPVDQTTEETIRSCQGTDFFFCTGP